MLLTSLALAFACTQDAAGERIRLLFLGDHGHHQPAARLQEAIGALALRGIVADWEDELARVTPARLARYDVVAVYANFPDHAAAPPEFLAALREHVAVRGRGLVALHCASACFPESPEWTRLIGARFDRHGGEVFTDETVAPEHPLLRGWQSFTTWDETYVHRDHHEAGRTVLTVRGAEREPWTWVRAEGAGRVFYTAWGHDERTWTQPGFLDLLARAALWTAGAEAAARHARSAIRRPATSCRPRPRRPRGTSRLHPACARRSSPPNPISSIRSPSASTSAAASACSSRATIRTRWPPTAVAAIAS
jgi:type 1 glutamine amidotransferase